MSDHLFAISNSIDILNRILTTGLTFVFQYRYDDKKKKTELILRHCLIFWCAERNKTTVELFSLKNWRTNCKAAWFKCFLQNGMGMVQNIERSTNYQYIEQFALPEWVLSLHYRSDLKIDSIFMSFLVSFTTLIKPCGNKNVTPSVPSDRWAFQWWKCSNLRKVTSFYVTENAIASHDATTVQYNNGQFAALD